MPTVTDMIKVMVRMEYRLRMTLNVVTRITKKATAIAIPKENIFFLKLKKVNQA